MKRLESRSLRQPISLLISAGLFYIVLALASYGEPGINQVQSVKLVNTDKNHKRAKDQLMADHLDWSRSKEKAFIKRNLLKR